VSSLPWNPCPLCRGISVQFALESVSTLPWNTQMSLNEFLEHYGTEAQCEAAVEHSRWPEGFVCPGCGGKAHSVVWHDQVKTFQCSRCRRQTTLTGGTIFHATKLPLKKWFQALYFLTQTKNNVSALELKRLMGVCYRTAWRLKHKLLQVMTEREQPRQLQGRVEADDAYLGGERPGGKAGRGSENKVPFIAAVETNAAGSALYAVFSRVKTFSLAEVATWAQQHLAASATVISDGLACFAAVTSAGCRHTPEVVGARRRSTELPCFNWVNTVLGNVKTAATGTYHAFDFQKYGYRYLAEAQYRFNRRFDLAALLTRLLRACVTTGKRTEPWLRLAEDEH
jgi:transposase-like protein